jgi:hypothetical protein
MYFQISEIFAIAERYTVPFCLRQLYEKYSEEGVAEVPRAFRSHDWSHQTIHGSLGKFTF